MLAEDQIPGDHYAATISRVFYERPAEQMPNESDADYETRARAFTPTWARAQCEILAAKDSANSAMQGRRFDYWLIGKRDGRKDLRTLLLHLHTYYPEAGWDQGIPVNAEGKKDIRNLEGTRFDATLKPYRRGNGQWNVEVNPIVHPGQKLLTVEGPAF
jgi:hypothetical protein